MAGGSAEDVHFMASQVRYKKRDGVMYLMSERVAWCPQNKDHFEVSHHYSEIKCQKISQEGKTKIQLQVVLLNGESRTFHFADADRNSAKEKRDRVKDILADMLPRFRRRIDKELEEKNRLLQEDPELFQMYKDLVSTQAITPEEFWAAHTDKLSNKNSGDAKQEVGVSASFLADVKPQSDGCNGLRYNLSADKIQSIFRTFPAVKKKYLDKVPDKMTEKEFWIMFFQSHYFHRDRVNLTSKDLFSDCVKKDDHDLIALIKNGFKDPFVNLANLQDEDLSTAEGYGGSDEPIQPLGKGKQSSTQLQNQAIIKRFNHQSAMILASLSSKTNNQNGSTENGVEDEEIATKKIKLQEATICDDLINEENKEESELKLQNSDRYSHGPTVLSESHNEMNSQILSQGLQAVVNQCSSYKPRLSQVLSSNDAHEALKDLSNESQSRGGVDENFIDHILPGNLKTELQHLYASSSELLRHFWSCFPVNTPFLQEKVVRMNTSLENFHREKLLSFKHTLAKNRIEINAVEHIEEMIDVATRKFTAWNSRANKKR